MAPTPCIKYRFRSPESSTFAQVSQRIFLIWLYFISKGYLGGTAAMVCWAFSIWRRATSIQTSSRTPGIWPKRLSMCSSRTESISRERFPYRKIDTSKESASWLRLQQNPLIRKQTTHFCRSFSAAHLQNS